MDVSAPKSHEFSTNDFVGTVFIILTIGILSSVFWSNEKDIAGYYQNLIIASFSIASVILDINNDINDNKKNGFYPPKFISRSYSISKLLVVICCAFPLLVMTMASKNNFLSRHVYCNKYLWLCLMTFIPITITVFWSHIYPLITDIPYTRQGIRYEERPTEGE